MYSAKAYGVLMPALVTLAAGLLFLVGEYLGGAVVGSAISFFGTIVTIAVGFSVGTKLGRARVDSTEQLVYIFVAPPLVLLSLFVVLICQSSPWYSAVAGGFMSFCFLIAIFYIAEKEGAPKNLVGEMLGPSLVGWPIPIIVSFTLHYFGQGFWGILLFGVLLALNTFLAAIGFGYFRVRKAEA